MTSVVRIGGVCQMVASTEFDYLHGRVDLRVSNGLDVFLGSLGTRPRHTREVSAR
jgi:hypothetical protein